MTPNPAQAITPNEAQAPFTTAVTPAPAAVAAAPAPTASSTGVEDFENCATVELPPSKGEYDTTVLKFDVTASKAKADEATGQVIETKGVYASLQLQLDTDPAKGRQIFDMAQLILKDGTVCGTVAAMTANPTNPNARVNNGVAILKQLGISLNILSLACKQARETGSPVPIVEVVGKTLRARYKHEKDQRDDQPRLRVAQVLGKVTGKGFTASGPGTPKVAAPATERF